MKRTITLKYCTTLGLAATLFTKAVAQDASAQNKTDKAAASPSFDMALMEQLAKPGDNHKLLADTVGQWTYKIKYWMSPDTNAPPLEASGITVTKPAMEGRYFISDVKGNMQMPGTNGAMMDMPFNGMSVDGYDNAKKKYVSSWIDNMGTGIMYSEGTYDSAAKEITYESEYMPIPGVKTKVRQVVTFTDNDHHIMEFFEQRHGTFVRVMRMDCSRSS